MSKWRAREMRNEPTLAERRLWNILYSLRQQGYHFRRQVQIGPYYADIACHHARLVIEVDGATHSSDEELARDKRRDRYLTSRGFRALRFWNHDIAENPSGVGEVILNALAGIEPLAPTPSPSPQGGGESRRRKVRAGLAELAKRTGDEVPAPPSLSRGEAGGGGSSIQHPRAQQ